MRVLLRKWKSNPLPDTPSIWFLKRSEADGRSPSRCGAQRKPSSAAHRCVGRRAQRTASSDSIFLLAGCPETLRCSICFVILRGPSRRWWQPWIQELVCFGGVGHRRMPRRLIYPLQERCGGLVLKDGVYFERFAPQTVVHHIPKNNAFLLPIPPSFIALFIDIFGMGCLRSISSYEEQMSQIPKFEQRRKRNPKRTTDFNTSILEKKLERKTSAFYFASCLPSTKKKKKSIGAEAEKKNATMFAYSIPKKQRHFWDSESRRGDVHKKKTTKLKLSPCPFSQFGAETQASATGNSLFAPGRIPSAATPWQTGPCVGLRAGAHCPPWLFTELCLKFHVLTLFVLTFNITIFHTCCAPKAESCFCKCLLLPRLYRSY